MPTGDVVYAPMRVVPDGDTCEVIFTVRRQPAMTDDELARDVGLVRADLTRSSACSNTVAPTVLTDARCTSA